MLGIPRAQRQPDGAPPLPPTVSDDQPHRVANRLNSIAIRLLRVAARADADSGLSPERLSLLSVLVYGGPCTATELARVQLVSVPAITRSVNALEAQGLVTRTRTGADRREVTVSATSGGKDLMEEGRARRVERLAQLLEGLSAGDLTALDAVTTRLGAHLRRG